jgi:pimeloyl-ACP methyl ester carboxylesterase/predicted glycosyltransferase
MRARQPDHEGHIERDGVRLRYQVYGTGGPTIFLLPCWTFFDSRVWKGQYAYLARHFRVVTFDPRGSKYSDTPGPEGFQGGELVADAVAVLDATETDRAVLAGLSGGALMSLAVAALHPDRVQGVVAFAPKIPLGDDPPLFTDEVWLGDVDEPDGVTHFNRDLWQRPGGFQRWIEYFMSLNVTEPNSTWPQEEGVRWALETGPKAATSFFEAVRQSEVWDDPDAARALLDAVQCPVLVVHGTADRLAAYSAGVAVADHVGGELVTYEGASHYLLGRHPVRANLDIRAFAESFRPGPAGRRRSWRRALTRPRRVLYLSSPIGLGHARRDLAIADELRKLQPDVEVDWLTQHPVTAMLADAGERVHPLARHLASESAHLESESAEHDLHCFQAIREMDEILVNNFMVFHDLMEAEHYDLVVADESLEVDYFLREHPELKRSPFAWISDFDGFLPMPGASEYERRYAAEHNAYTVDAVERFPNLRDEAIFVGNPDDIVPARYGPDLPVIRDWVEDHFRFAGYVTGFDPIGEDAREALRLELGYRPDERVCMVTVGGSGVGGALVAKVVAAHEHARRLVDDLRMVVVTGPRLDPASVPPADGLEVHGYVPDLYRHLAVCDIAVVQGGLTTTMELTANRRPFLYFPLRHHFEQNIHVRHRLERYGAGRCMDYGTETPESIARAIAEEIGRPVDYRPVESDGAARAAALLSELL